MYWPICRPIDTVFIQQDQITCLHKRINFNGVLFFFGGSIIVYVYQYLYLTPKSFVEINCIKKMQIIFYIYPCLFHFLLSQNTRPCATNISHSINRVESLCILFTSILSSHNRSNTEWYINMILTNKSRSASQRIIYQFQA